MLDGVLDIKTLFLIVHIFGVAIGAGGAFASDAMFFLSVKDKNLSKTELLFMRLGSKLVWGGLILLIASGIGLFLTAPEVYLASSKFLAKMTIVAIITINGTIFHLAHMPRFHRHQDHHLPSSDEFARTSPYLMISGAVSALSWSWAIALGVLRGLPYTYTLVMAAYLGTILIAIIVALIIRKRLLGLQY